MNHANAGEPCICGDHPGGACDQALCTVPSPQDIDILEQRLDDADYARRDLQKRYDALAAENAKLREILADARSELLHARHFQLTFEGAEVVTRIHAALAEPQAVQPSAPCEECGGTGIVERKEDSAPMECWACSPQPSGERT